MSADSGRPGRATRAPARRTDQPALDIAEIVRQLLEEGWEIDPEDLAHISPYLTEHINRFGEYSTHELGIQPKAYDPKLDVDFTPLREQDAITAGFDQAA
ncbi:Tn3 family transposase [Streptomyces sp. NPDC059679]|uniref:Tn3 family transposase n=1 Tax=Streptomyces sp. NPDC059679 TaxID=3346903 RepID=UPI0036935211